MKNKSTLLTVIILAVSTLTSLSYAQLVTSGLDDGSDGTLRNEIADTPSGGTITFMPSVTTVDLNSELLIDKDLTITGVPITTVTIDANANGRIFNVSAGNLILNNLTLTNGVAPDGGAIYMTNANVTINDCVISNNVANATGSPAGSGGGIFNDVGGILVVNDSEISNNTANRAGGGIEDKTAGGATITTTLNNVSLLNNNAGVAPALAAPGNGGGIHVSSNGSVNINGGVAIGNIAALEGGALWNGFGTMTVDGMTINNNDAQGAAADNGGGGIFNNGGALIVTATTTITNNTASGALGSGGGIFSLTPGTLSIDGLTIENNTANRAGGGIEINSTAGETYTFNDVNLNGNIVNGPAPGNGGGFHITGMGDVVYNGGTVSNNVAFEGGGLWNSVGSMTINGTTITGNTANGDVTGGGGLFNNGGTLNVSSSTTLTGNIAMAATPGGRGGGIFNNTGGTLNVASGSTISGNYASRAGGAIEDASGGTLTLDSVTLTGNSAGVDIGLGAMANPGNGGAIHLSGTTSADITNSTVTLNLAASEGGGLWNNLGVMLVDNTLVDGNDAQGDPADNGGGGIFNNGGTLTIQNLATITNNTASGLSGSGGGVFSTDGLVTVNTSWVAYNTSNRAGGGIELIEGTLNLINTTLDFNTTGSSPGNGGGLHITGAATANILDGTVNNNIAAREGGGLWNGSGTMTIDGTVINGNDAQGAGADDGGGGIFNNGGALIVTATTTITNNTASGALGSGGGIFSLTPGTLSIDGLTIENNTANRAGGGIEINSTAGETYTFNDVNLNGNIVNGPAPGNGGGFHITGMGDVVYNGGTVSNNVAFEGGGLWNSVGSMTINGTTITGNTANGDVTGGGGLFNNGGTLNVSSSTTLTGNIAMAATPGGRGGGIFNNTGGTLNVASGSTISGNYASRAGGAIEDASGGTLTLDSVTLTGNSAGVDIGLGAMANPGNGGAIHLSGTTSADISNSTVTLNLAASEGGGLWNNLGVMLVDNTLVDGNDAQGDPADNGGGGIFNNGGTLTIQNLATITNNTASGLSGSGGGVFSTDGLVTVNTSWVAYNTSNRAGGGIELIEGTLNLINTTLDFNTTGSSPGNGGGLHITGSANANILDGTVNNNTAASEGGGLWNGFGTMTVDGVTIENNTANGDAADNGGGGVFNNGGTLIVQNGTVITSNLANGTAGSGGGIQNVDGGSITILNSSISGNSANRAGGGIEDNSTNGIGTLVLTNTNLDNNSVGSSPGNGGGLHITGPGNATITGGTVNGNIAALEGGGLWNGSGLMIVDGTTIDNNTANGDAADDGGGGIFNNGGTLNITGATQITNNDAAGVSGSGGGILSLSGTLTVDGLTAIDNNAANRAGGGVEVVDGDASFTDAFLRLNDVNGTAGSPAPGNGGAFHVTGNSSTITFEDTIVSDNEAASEGGGLWNQVGSTMNITNTQVTGNVAYGDAADNGGGGIFNNGGTLNYTNTSAISSLSNNSAVGAAGSGGGLLSTDGVVTLIGISIGENDAVRAGGGIEIIEGTLNMTDVLMDLNVTGAAPGNGGGLHITGGANSNITGGIVSNNSAAREGGGLWNGSGVMTLDAVLIDANIANGNAADDGGAGIFNNGGTLNVTNGTVVSNNIAFGTSASGGGLLSTAGDVTVTNSTFNANLANRAGGAIELIDGNLTFTNSVMSNNDVSGTAGSPAPGNGGGFHVTGTSGTINISTSTITGNAAANEGGGLWNQNGTVMNVTMSTVDNNFASIGGGIYNNAGAVTTVMTSTISGNSASVSGGGVTNNGASLDLNAVTIAQNTSAGNGGGIDAINNVSLKNTIVALNTAASGVDVSGTLTSNDYNLIGMDDLAVFTAQSNDIEGVDPVIGPLQDNGGTTFTHQLLDGSPAFDAGDSADTFVDQIGQSVFGGARDIGAYESQVALSINDFSQDAILSVYPNPTNGEFNIELGQLASENIDLKIISITGKMVKEMTLKQGLNTININGLNSGLYILNLTSDNNTVTHKLILN